MIKGQADKILCVSIRDDEAKENNQESTQGIGIDLGLKEFVVCSNGLNNKNINKIKEVKKLEKKLKREQCCLSRKYEGLKKRNKNNEKGEAGLNAIYVQ